jgi:sulfur carrier protein ThiS adenylyltransferase
MTNNPFEKGLARYLTTQQLTMIQKKHIGIAGAGGLGSNIAFILLRTGFRRLTIVDKDKVEASNLNRQAYTLADIGKPKAQALKKHLLKINPDAEITSCDREWRPDETGRIFSQCPILVEAFDQADVKTAFVAWASTRASWVVSGNGMAGLSGGDPTKVRKVGNIYIVGDEKTSIHDGQPALAPRVLQCASKMAEIVLALTLKIKIS